MTPGEKNKRRRVARRWRLSPAMTRALVCAKVENMPENMPENRGFLAAQCWCVRAPIMTMRALVERGLAYQPIKLADGRWVVALRFDGVQARTQLVEDASPPETFAHPRSPSSISECSGGTTRRADQ